MSMNGINNFGNPNFENQLEPNYDRSYIECEQMFSDADKLINDGQIAEAVEKLTKIIQRNSAFGKAYNHLGWIYETKYKNYSRAEEYYRMAIQNAPEYAAPYLNYAYFLSALNRYDELKTHLDNALTVASVAKEIIYNEYGIMYEAQGNPQLAIDYYFKAAMGAFDDAKFKKYQESIERCKRKIELQNSMGGFLSTPPTPLNY